MDSSVPLTVKHQKKNFLSTFLNKEYLILNFVFQERNMIFALDRLIQIIRISQNLCILDDRNSPLFETDVHQIEQQIICSPLCSNSEKLLMYIVHNSSRFLGTVVFIVQILTLEGAHEIEKKKKTSRIKIWTIFRYYVNRIRTLIQSDLENKTDLSTIMMCTVCTLFLKRSVVVNGSASHNAIPPDNEIAMLLNLSLNHHVKWPFLRTSVT